MILVPPPPERRKLLKRPRKILSTEQIVDMDWQDIEIPQNNLGKMRSQPNMMSNKWIVVQKKSKRSGQDFIIGDVEECKCVTEGVEDSQLCPRIRKLLGIPENGQQDFGEPDTSLMDHDGNDPDDVCDDVSMTSDDMQELLDAVMEVDRDDDAKKDVAHDKISKRKMLPFL